MEFVYKYMILICLLFISLIVFVNSENVCSHYKLKRKTGGNLFIKADYDEKIEWAPIRILPDYSGLKSKDPESAKLTETIKTKIIPKTIKVFQELLKVRKIKSITLTEKSCAAEYSIPQEIFGKNHPIETDLIILVNYDQTGFYRENRVEASAIHCFQDQKTKRPLVGLITFRDNLLVNTDVDIDYLVWLALHEISHVLLFNEDLYTDFIDENFNKLSWDKVIKTQYNEFSQKIDYVITKNVVEKARKHYGCKNLFGVPLEYNGSENSTGGHWSRKALNTDYMIGRSHGENLISEITLAFFEDSGWYKVDYKKANIFHWGKDKGCSFMNKNCVKKSKIIKTVKKKITPSTVFRNKRKMRLLLKKFKIEDNPIYYHSSLIEVETNFKKEYCEEINQPVCSMHNMFRGYCGATVFMENLPKKYQNFSNARIGGLDDFVNRCPIVVENKFSQKYYGGSCRFGSKEDLFHYEKVGDNSGCFVSSLSKKKDDVNKEILEEKTAFSLDVYSKPSDVNLRAACIEYKCVKGEINVFIDGKKFLCPSKKTLKVGGYHGRIFCPEKEIMCDKKYFCKFGCTNVK